MPHETSLKFDPDGQAKPYPGNTVISFIREERFAVYRLAKEVSQRFRSSGLAHCYAFLPYESFHVTVLKLCREIDRGTPRWPALLPPDASFAEVDRYLQSAFERTTQPGPITMRAYACEDCNIRLEPAAESDARRIALYREQLAQAAGLRHEDHDHYSFHLTFSYRLAALDAQQEATAQRINGEYTDFLQREEIVFEMPEPVFTIFNDMLHYDTDLRTRSKT